jgi:pyruvate dehydrogenase complex dehydrogenase (E1) component
MYVKGEDVSTTSRSTTDYTHAADAARRGRDLKGLYLFRGAVRQAKHRAQILGSGPILLQALRAQRSWRRVRRHGRR